MPKKEKVRDAVRKLTADVGACIPLQPSIGDRSAYRTVDGDDDAPSFLADTPGGRAGVPPIRVADVGELRTRAGEAGRREGDAFVMDPSLATPVRLPSAAATFTRVVADPSLAGVDFVTEEPAPSMLARDTPPFRELARADPIKLGANTSRDARHGSHVQDAGPGQPRSARLRELRDGDRMAVHKEDSAVVHEPGQRWHAMDDGAEADGEADGETDGDGPFLEHDDDGIELLNLRRAPATSSSTSSHGGGDHGLSGGKITRRRAFVHILKAYIGSGVLGLPYAYAQGGMLAAMAGMCIVSILSTMCVFLLLDCKHKLPGRVRSFGDVGYGALGRTGHVLVEVTVVLSQMGFSCAYLIFVSQNLFLYLKEALSSEAAIVWYLVPLLVGLSWIPSLDVLAPFSVLALALIFSGLGIVAWHAAPSVGRGPDVQSYIPSTMPIFIGMAIYAFEGIGLALPIQNQMMNPESFKTVWIQAMVVVTITYVGFGAFCYSCYGDEVLHPTQRSQATHARLPHARSVCTPSCRVASAPSPSAHLLCPAKSHTFGAGGAGTLDYHDGAAR
jgi:hypothetical protein